MPVPVITAPDPALRLIPVGVSFTLSLVASNTPTSWAATGLPAGLAFNTATGAITGAPTVPEVASTVSITATNADGTSAAVTLKLWVLDAITGLDDAADMALPIDWDWITNQLTVPGLTGPEPANYPPTGGRGADLVETAPLIGLKVGDRREVSIGIRRGDLLFTPANLTGLYATLKRNETEAGVAIIVDPADITVTGSGQTARHELLFALPETGFAAWLTDSESADSAALAAAGLKVPPQTWLNALLELVAERHNDARAFSATATQAIASIGASETENHTFSVTLANTITEPVDYRVVAEFLSPDNVDYPASLTLTLSVIWTGSAYVATVSGDTLPKSTVKTPSNPDRWNLTFSVQSITGDAAGFDVALRAVTGTETLDEPVTVIASLSGYGPGTTSSAINAAGSGPHWELYDEGDSLLGSISFPVDPASPDDAAALKTKIETAISETLTSVAISASALVSIEFAPDTAVAYIRDLTASPSPVDFQATGNEPLVLTNTSFKITVTGQPTETTVRRITSLSAPVRLVRRLRPTA